MLYELREYTAVPGRLPALITRFNDHTFRLFHKHRMIMLQMGRTSFGDNSVNELVYLMQFDDHADMEAKWATFLSDPEWVSVKNASEADGPLVQSVRRRLLDPSPFNAAVGGHVSG